MRASIATILLICGGLVQVVVAADSKRFISCPVYRDTVNARKSGCWLVTEYETGQRYDLQQAQTKPQLGHAVLVEAMVPDTAQAETSACGAVVLRPVRVSVLPTTCPATIIPAEGYSGKRFEVPDSAMTPNYLPQPMPKPPYVTREFNIYFDYNDDYLIYQHAETIIQEAVRLAQLGKASRLLVTGYAATRSYEASGQVIQESVALAKARARMVTEALTRLGIPRALVTVAWHGDPPADRASVPALQEASKRRVTIQVQIDKG
jgi:outer membrane protein OmpA-like peptidoglycan-associated protein